MIKPYSGLILLLTLVFVAACSRRPEVADSATPSQALSTPTQVATPSATISPSPTLTATPTPFALSKAPEWKLAAIISQTTWLETLVFSPDGQLLLTRDQWGLTSVIDTTSKTLLWQTAYVVTHGRQAVAFSSDSCLVMAVRDATIGLTSAIDILDALTGEVVTTIELNHLVHKAILSPDDTRLVAIGEGVGQIWDMTSAQEIARFELRGGANVVAFDPSGQMLVTGSTNGDVEFWDSHTGQTIRSVNVREIINQIVFSSQGEFLIAFSTDNHIGKIIRMSTGEVIAGIEGMIYQMTFSPDEKWLAVVRTSQKIELWLTSSWSSQNRLLRANPIQAIEINPEGNFLITEINKSQDAWMDALALQNAVANLPFTKKAFSADYRLIATGDKDASLWEVPLVAQSVELVAIPFIPTPTPEISAEPAQVILVAKRVDNDSFGNYSPTIQSLQVTYSPLLWEYNPPFSGTFILSHRNLNGCGLYEHRGRGLAPDMFMESLHQPLTDNLERDFRVRSGDKTLTVVYSVPVSAIALEMQSIKVEDEAACMQAAEEVLLTLEIITKPLAP